MGCIRNSRDYQKQDQFSHGQIQGEKVKKSNAAVRRTQQLASNSSTIALTRQIGGVVARIVLTLLVLAAAGFAVKLYLVQELIAGLLLVGYRSHDSPCSFGWLSTIPRRHSSRPPMEEESRCS